MKSRPYCPPSILKRIFLFGIFGVTLAGLRASDQAAVEKQDVLVLITGERRAGQFAGMDDQWVRLRLPMSTGQAMSTISLPRNVVTEIFFYEPLETRELVEQVDPASLSTYQELWRTGRPWLGVMRSPAARYGNIYADLLLLSEQSGLAGSALEIFQEIEAEAWDENERAFAKQGRLRALVALGRAGEAVEEAFELAETAEDPSVLIQAKYILAELKDRELRELLEENPRWEEDSRVRPVRNQLYNEALDLFLFPYLFFGSDMENAARGLWGAVRVYELGGDLVNARESCRDLTQLYAQTRFAALAEEFLAQLPEEITQYDHEKDAQDTME
jgi:hypothetical protein